MKIAYVVLHYMAGKDTIECAESIIKVAAQSQHEIKIVIVDNCSTNDSLKDIKNHFEGYSEVEIIVNDKNLGFAQGNNKGFYYAKHVYGADFIVMLNNDTIVSQMNFNEVLVDKFNSEQYYVLGPDIVTADGYHQNPGRKQTWSLRELKMFRIKKRIRILLSYLMKVKSDSKLKEGVQSDYELETCEGDVKNTILHGACWIFSPLYIKKFEGINGNTFLYMEEDILKLYADCYNFLMIYSSELSIYHKEDVATNMVEGDVDKKLRRKYRYLIESSKVYSKLKRKMTRKIKIINFIEKTVGIIKKSGSAYKIDIDMPLTYLISIIMKRIVMLIRGKIKCIGVKHHGRNVFVDKNVKLKCKSKIQIGTGVTIQKGVYIDALSKNGFQLGNGCSIGSGTIIRCSGNYKELGMGFVMGNNSSLADNCFVGATGGVWIGDDVIGGQNIRFHSSNHVYEDSTVLIRNQGVTTKGIHIGNNCWIGAGTVFCDGASIGNGCVVGANTVVTKKFPDNSIIVGCPGKIIGVRE